MRFQDIPHYIDTPIFSLRDLTREGGRINQSQLSQWVKKEQLIKLRNGLYAMHTSRGKITGQEIAARLYEPSYLSLETALSHYGFIPEIVHGYTSVTTRTTRTFRNSCGHFLYRHVKNSLFWGYVEISTETGRYLIAEPEKALLDYLYLNIRRIRSKDDIEELRLNEQEMGDVINGEKFLRYLKGFGSMPLERLAPQCLP